MAMLSTALVPPSFDSAGWDPDKYLLRQVLGEIHRDALQVPRLADFQLACPQQMSAAAMQSSDSPRLGSDVYVLRLVLAEDHLDTLGMSRPTGFPISFAGRTFAAMVLPSSDSPDMRSRLYLLPWGLAEAHRHLVVPLLACFPTPCV